MLHLLVVESQDRPNDENDCELKKSFHEDLLGCWYRHSSRKLQKGNMYDIHTHLYFDSYDKDLEAVLSRAKAAGIEKMIVVGCTGKESQLAVELSLKYPELFASIGIHPHEFNIQREDPGGWLAQELDTLRTLAREGKVVAIGECGLDYYSHDPAQRVSEEQQTFQKEGFQRQIALAKELALPLIIHTRPSTRSVDAYEDMLTILKAKSSQLKACILHCYMGDTEITKQFLELPNVYFSFAGNITYPVKKALIGSRDDLTETVKRIPLDRILVETDCPFLSPQAHRGERNEPAYVVEVVRKLGELMGYNEAAIQEGIDRTVRKIFFSQNM